MLTFATLLLSSFVAHADIDSSYDACVKAARDDAGSAKCLDVAAVDLEKALTDIVDQIVRALEVDEKPKVALLREAHAKWLPSRDADCNLQGAVTMDTPEDAADAAKLCVYQAGIPRLKQYQRFLGFLAK